MSTPAKVTFLPREHGATAMLLIPFFSAALLAREWRNAELAALIGILCVFAAKDPLIVLARQRWIWKQPHSETSIAKSWLTAEALILAACGLVLAVAWPLWILAFSGVAAAAFSALAVAINVKNRQRSTVFQVVSAAALSSTSLAACLTATGSIRPWCWWLWALCALQSTAGILVVHARLDGRIALRKKPAVAKTWRRPAIVSAALLLCTALAAAFAHQPWIAIALGLAGSAYFYELHRQRDAACLQMSLTRLGLQAMSLSIAYALQLVAGLW